MSPLDALNKIKTYGYYRSQVVSEFQVPERKGILTPLFHLKSELERPLCEALEAIGVENLYGHQKMSIEILQAKKNVIVTAPTASGKSLCYQLPVLNTLLQEPQKRALFLYPTKALAQDQYYQMKRIIEASPELMSTISLGFYDGDTPDGQKKRVRKECNVIFSNPDMLHASILPTHGRWGSFFWNLDYVVLDEAHLYRGVFGSHVSLVLRRLKRLAHKMKGRTHSISWILCSASIKNPVDLGQNLVGEPFEHVDESLAPRKAKDLAFWKETEEGERYQDTLRLVRDFHKSGHGCILFVATRAQCELMGRYLKEEFRNSGLEESNVILYRGGYSAQERRAMEKSLREASLEEGSHGKVVVSTSALEVGIDVGHLDVSLLFGFPRSMSSFWQQAGRAGRGKVKGMVVYIASGTPMDQYLLKNPDFALEHSQESVHLDPRNPYILSEQIKCAAHEFPLSEKDGVYFGERYQEVLQVLKEEGELRELQGKWHLPTQGGYASHVNIRNFGGDEYQLYDENRREMGSVEEFRVLRNLSAGSIYLMWGNTYQVVGVIEELKEVHLQLVNVNYFTKPMIQSTLKWLDTLEEQEQGLGKKRYGNVVQSSSVYKRKRIQFHTGYVQGVENMQQVLPALKTTCTLLIPSSRVQEKLQEKKVSLLSALLGLKNLLEYTLPVSTLSDPVDLQVIVESHIELEPVLAILDVYPEGIGLSQKAFEWTSDFFHFAENVLDSCSCDTGCPGCTGYEPQLAGDADVLPHKWGAKVLLQDFLSQ